MQMQRVLGNKVVEALNRTYSHRELNDGLTLSETDEVVVEEVYIESCLQDSTQYLSPAVEVIHVESVHPTPISKLKMITS